MITKKMVQVLAQTRFILIDDSYSEEIFLREALHALSVEDQISIQSFRSKSEALEVLCPSAPTLMELEQGHFLFLVDLMLQGEYGLDVVAELRQIPAFAETPMIVFTSSLQTDWFEEAYAKGANAIINKPLSFASWVDTIDAVLKFWVSARVAAAQSMRDVDKPQ